MRFAITLLTLLLTLPAAANAQQFTNLLEGNLQRLMKPNGDAVQDGWKLDEPGVLHMSGGGGNIVTREEYGDFELWFEFKISEKGNNGIKYRVKPYDGRWLGIEYQILDDSAFQKLGREHLTASLYDLTQPMPQVTRVNPVGQFNIGKIRVEHGRTQHWVNGQLTIQEPLFGERWESLVSSSKFKKHEGFGQNQTGRIMLTDHKSEAWFRNVYIRRLNTTNCVCPAP